MAGFRIDSFRGLRPRISAKKLPLGESVTAENLKLGSGDLEPIPEKVTEQAVGSGRMSRTIYLFDNAGSPIWFEWDDYVDIARGPVKDDLLERTYYTGDTFGNGAPKMTTTGLADLGGGGPYPEDWLYIGVPAPETAPTVTPTDLPEDKPPGERLATNMITQELIIDQVQWTVYPGTGTRNQTWRLNAGAAGCIAFDVLPGSSFRVASIVNNNKVTIESATEPGVTARTLNSDKTTVNDWHPMDEQGSTQEADFIGWRIPPGLEIKIIDHNLNVGDVITVSAQNIPWQFCASLVDDFDEESWAVESLINEGGTSFYQVQDAVVSGEFATYGGWPLTGSFYYDVDRAASTASELEDRSYVYTYVNTFGEEGPPSPPSTSTPLLDGQSVLVEDLALPPTIGYDITLMRLYRTNSTEAGTEFQFVKEFTISRTTRDTVLSADLAEIIASTTWDPPDPLMKGIVALPNGILAGFKGKQLYFCEPYFPHAWPAEYDQAIEYEIVGLAPFGNSLAIMTKGWPYIATGSHSRNMNIRPLKINQACLSKESIASDGDHVYYASPDGIVEIGINGIKVATEDVLDPDDWQAYMPATIVGEFFEGRYYGFYDFDVSGVDPVITAEVSGSITDADEADIVNGAKIILLELQNDNWVASGVSFNNQRQAIIDGLTASTAQTLGWNNIVRDGVLAVGDVVRTSDTLVTITLPAAPGYAITSSETIQPDIPNAALLLSTSDLETGSTFKIEPQEAVATVTMSGTADGALEAEIVTGGETILLTLTNDTWTTSAGGGQAFNSTVVRQGIINGLVASTNEQDGWNDRVIQEIAETDVVRTSDTVVTITLPAVALYVISENETITCTVPHEALATQVDVDQPASNSIGILATGVASALFSGDITASVTENEMVTGGKQLVITLTNDTWIAAGTGPIGTIAQTDSIIDALIATTSQTLGWNNVIVPGVETTDLVRTSPTVATITFDPEATYSIATNETIGATIPADVLVTSTGNLDVSNQFGITAQTPVTCTLSGSITSSTTEVDIVAGGKEILLTLSDDTWVALGATFNAQRQNIIDGLTASTSQTNGWNNEIRDGSMAVGDVVRTSDTVVTISVGADAQYDISSNETIEATIPASALVISASAVVASPTFTIAFDVPATIAQTGTADNDTNDDIITGGSTIILTVSNDTWVAAGATFNAERQGIIDGLDAASSPTNGWNNEIRDVIGVGQVVRTSSTIVTITLPATPLYDINANEVITITVPASALVENTSAVIASPSVDITANETFTTRVFVGTADVHNEGVNDNQLNVTYYDPDYDYFRGQQIAGDRYTSNACDSSGNYVQMLYDTGFPDHVTVYRSTDLGENFSSVLVGADDSDTSSSLSYVDTPDGEMFFAFFDGFGISGGQKGHYSDDGGATWTDITAAIETPSGADLDTSADFIYGGDYVYVETAGGLIRSADLSTASTIETNWTTNIADPAPTRLTNIGTGNGILLYAGNATSGSSKALWYMNHGDTSWNENQWLPSSTSASAEHIAFGGDFWIILDGSGKGWFVDINGGAVDETEADNWTRISTAVVESGLGDVKDLWYDTDLGFCMIVQVGTSAARVQKLYTNDLATDAETWTLRNTFDDLPFTIQEQRESGCSINQINGTDLD